MNPEDIQMKKKEIKETLRCPHCNAELKKWEVPQNIFTEWPNEYFYICFNDECQYFTRSRDAMEEQGSHCSYRLMYDHLTDSCNPIPVTNCDTLRDGIIE